MVSGATGDRPVEKYFETLGRKGFLKYVLIYEKDKTLFGIYDFTPLQAYIQDQGGKGYENFQIISTRAIRHRKMN